jgi:hypothetical protein
MIKDTAHVSDEAIVFTSDISTETIKSAFNRLIQEPFPVEIKAFNWPSTGKNCTELFPGQLDLSPYKEKYNSYIISMTVPLTKKFRVKIPNGFDAFHAIKLPCVDARIDIKSVTLFTVFLVPIDEKEIFEPGDSYIYHEDKCRKVYIPVKKLDNIDSNVITFSDHPIVANKFNQYSIEIEFAPHIKKSFNTQFFCVEMDCYFFPNSDIRKKVIQSGSLY